MRIVIDMQPCQNGSRHRGIGRHSMSFIRAMVNAGRNHEFVLAFNRNFAAPISEIRRTFDGLLPPSAFVSYSAPPMATAADPNNAWRNRAAEMVRSHFLETLEPDIVFIPSLFEGLWDDTIVSIEKNVPYLTAVTLYDLIPLDDVQRYLGGDNDCAAYFRRLNDARRADLLLAISRYVKDDAIAKIAVPENKVMVAYCGVDDMFAPPRSTQSDRAALCAKYGITRPYVMTASPLEPRKNIEGLIAGFASMSKSVRDGHQLVFAGKMDAFARRYITGLARDEGLLEDSIVFPGFVPDADLPSLYHDCSVFAFPSFSEGFGLPLLEAMACGAPVVGSSTTSMPEVLGRDDLACDPANTVEIGRAIERILTDEALQQELREYGIKRASLFSWDTSARAALATFETLHQRRATFQSQPADTEKPKSAKMALIAPDVAADHRLSGLVNSLAAALAERFDLTLISEGRHSNRWLRANCEVKDRRWFAAHTDRFNNVLYVTDYMADADFRRLMQKQKGNVVMTERFAPPEKDKLVGRRLFDGAELAVFDTEGFAGLSRAVTGQIAPSDMVDLLIQDVSERAATFYREGDAKGGPATIVGFIPTELSKEARKAFCDKVGANAGSNIIIALAGDKDSATAVIRNFREACVDMLERPTLIVWHRDEDVTPGAEESSQLTDGVIRIGHDLDSIYCGLLSAAKIVLVDDALPADVRNRISLDKPSGQIHATHALTADTLGQWLGARESAAPDGDVEDVIRVSKAGAARTAQLLSVANLQLSDNDRALKGFIERLPEEVRGKRPDSNDLAQVAIALTRNERVEREPQIYIDITAFAKADATHRLDQTTRNWLLSLFRQARSPVRAVFYDGGNFVVANKFAAKLCGVMDSSLKDHLLKGQAGDQIIGFDLFHSFFSGVEALKAAYNEGVRLNYVALDDLAFQRETSMEQFAHAILSWAAETNLSNYSSLAGVTEGGAVAALQALAARDGGLKILLEADLPVAALDCPKLFTSDPLPADIADTVSPIFLRAVEEWRKQRQNPIVHSQNGVTAADLGHVVAGHILGSYSLAIINRMLARTLEASFPGQARFVPIETVPINHTEGVPEDDKTLMIELSTRESADERDEIIISHHYPVVVPDGDYRLKLALFFWEETAVPAPTVDRLANGFDAIISPARTVTSALVDSGLSIPIATIGQPVDIEPYAALAEGRKARGEEICFLHVSSCFKRKGIDVLLAAWAKAFTSSDPVRLVIKTFPNPHNDVEQQLADLKNRYPDLAKVEIVNRDVEQQELLQFYSRADVMVLPSRGEGYNLPALEAMASGLPLIVTGHGGQRDFCGPQEARLLDYRFAKSGSHVSGHHSLWVEPDVDDLVAALKEQIDPAQAEIIEERRVRAMSAARRESDRVAWLHRYTSMAGDLLTIANRETARVAWISTWGVQCGIAQYSQYLIEHFSVAARRELTVICDYRTGSQLTAEVRHRASWPVENVPKLDGILNAVDEADVEAVVIQHQDGLISWDQLGRLALDDRFADKVSVIVLHNPGNMRIAGDLEVKLVLEGLGKFSRVLVHNVSDMNFLVSMGLKHNVGLLPHGAFARDNAPWPKRFGPQDGPIIGCHGFFFRHKGIDKLIQAAAMLRREWPNLKLRLVNAKFPGEGHDAYILECKALARSLGMYDAIEWHQDFLPIDKIDALLAGCDLIVLPYSESTDSASGAVRVSLASMVPLVATRVKIFAELEDAAGWADNNDPEILAEVIGELLNSPEKRRTIQAAMHEWLSAHDWRRVAGTLENLLHALVQQKRLGWDSNRNGI